ncbi:glycosyltransferase [Zoogloea sp.]|uniref:glycosyltransferase n=1 Tax=Zoogloea sp. TaxID=49181 RepID=UPI0035B43040
MSGREFSVLMATYGRDDAGHLEQALDSLLGQSLPASEVVLVEDGPIGDAARAVIADRRTALNIQSVVMPRNVGLASALNAGLQRCHHEIVVRFDSDDVALPQRFARQISAFDVSPELDVMGSYAQEMDSAGAPGRIRTMPVSHGAILATLWACPLIHPTVAYRRSRILAIGGYRSDLRRSEDYDLWFRCAKAGMRFANLPEALILHRFDETSHMRHAFRDALERATTGYRGASLLGMPWWKRAACFVPLVRAVLPLPLRHGAYRLLSRFDPRRRGPEV